MTGCHGPSSPETSTRPTIHTWTMSVPPDLIKMLGIKKKCGLRPFIHALRALLLCDTRPQNHNVLLEAPRAEYAYVYRKGHWRGVDPDNGIEDAMNEVAVSLLDAEYELERGMSKTAFQNFTRARDRVEKRDLWNGEGAEQRCASAAGGGQGKSLVAFTERRPALLAFAKRDAETARPIRRIRTRDLPTWQIGGERWMAPQENAGDWGLPTATGDQCARL